MRARRRPVTDELVVDGEMVLLVDGQVIVLSNIASTALDRMSTEVWTSVDDLTDVLEATFGLPDDGPAAVFSLVNSLADAGLVAVDHPPTDERQR